MSQSIGYTDDGLIFLRADVEHPAVGPVQLTLSWIPKDARKIAKMILEQADKCEGQARIWTPRKIQ